MSTSNFTSKGAPGPYPSSTVPHKGAAFEKVTRYLRANVAFTGSWTALQLSQIRGFRSTFPIPMSPWTLKRIPSLLALTSIVSPNYLRSRHPSMMDDLSTGYVCCVQRPFLNCSHHQMLLPLLSCCNCCMIMRCCCCCCCCCCCWCCSPQVLTGVRSS